MGFYIDLQSISIDAYKEKLKASDLLPSRQMLKDNIEERFELIKKQGVPDAQKLFNTLKTKKRLNAFAERSGLPVDFLTILGRELRSYRQKPNELRNFPGIDEDIISKLENIGLKNTFQFYSKVLTATDRVALSKHTEIAEHAILTLTKLTDLSRIRWVNHTFAYVLFEAQYDTVEKVAKADYIALYDAVKQLNEQRELYRGHIGVHDMKLCVEAAKDVSLEIQY